MVFLRRWENWSTQRKSSWSKGENQQQTQPTLVTVVFRYKSFSLFCTNFILRQSQMGKLGRQALSPQELASFQDSICTLAAASQKGMAADDDSLDADVMSQLLSQHVQGTLGEGAAAQSSQGM